MPCGTVVIGKEAFDLSYANNPTNRTEITNAIVGGGGGIYVKDFSGSWILNTTGLTINANLIQGVVYNSMNGR